MQLWLSCDVLEYWETKKDGRKQHFYGHKTLFNHQTTFYEICALGRSMENREWNVNTLKIKVIIFSTNYGMAIKTYARYDHAHDVAF